MSRTGNFISAETVLPVVDGTENKVGFTKVTISEAPDRFIDRIASASITKDADIGTNIAQLMSTLGIKWLLKKKGLSDFYQKNMEAFEKTKVRLTKLEDIF